MKLWCFAWSGSSRVLLTERALVAVVSYGSVVLQYDGWRYFGKAKRGCVGAAPFVVGYMERQRRRWLADDGAFGEQVGCEFCVVLAVVSEKEDVLG